MIKVGNLCEICDGTEIENVWFTGANWVNGAVQALPSAPYTITTTGNYTFGNINVNVPITITALAPTSKKLKATWSAAWTGGTYTSYPAGYTVSPSTITSGTITTISNTHPMPLPVGPSGIHCSAYVANDDVQFSPLDVNGCSWQIQNFNETKFISNETIGLIVHMDKDIARMLIEDKLYLVPVEKLKVIS